MWRIGKQLETPSMTEHATEIMNLLTWVILGGGGLFLALAKWIAAQLMRKLEGIEQAIKETNVTLSGIERRHESRIVDVERRVDAIAQKCSFYHAKP